MRDTIAAKPLVLVEPHRFASPDDAVDRETAADVCARPPVIDGVGAAQLDADVARRLARQHRQRCRACRCAPSSESATRAPRAAHNFVQ